jgi:DNA mismatch repair protein MutS2
MSLFDSREGRRTLELLEWPVVLEEVAEQCSLEAAAARVRVTRPLDDLAELRASWKHFDEVWHDAEASHSLPLGSMVDLDDQLSDEKLRRGPLTAIELVAVGAAAEALGQLTAHVTRHAERLPASHGQCPDLPGCEGLTRNIDDCLDRDGRVLDGASPRLRSMRQNERSASSRWRDAAQSQMRRTREAGWTTAEELTLRGDRYVIPVHARSRGRVAGIIHDRSATGATLYIEPLVVVEAANDLAQARSEVFEEEQRILLGLHQQVAALRDELRAGHRFAVAMDMVRARVRWGRVVGGQVPDFGDRDGFVVQGYRHPPLRRSLGAAGRAEDLVPLNLRLEDTRALLVSGPNAGGKSLLLKSLAMVALLAQSTLPIPANAPPQLPIFDGVFLELGDDQSIADALSSFSAHLTHLRALLAEATGRSLVLLDELGGGTDPQEGVALAWAILEDFVVRGARVVATTHYGELKALVEEDERFRHASMDFDPQRLLPRFEVRLDTPGSSHALAIASRLGLPESVTERARQLVGGQRLQLDELLRSLQEQRDGHARARAEVGEARDEARLRQQEYERRVREWKKERREKIAQAESEAAGILRNARRKVERLLERVRSAGADEAAREAARQSRREVDAAVAAHEERARVRESEPAGGEALYPELGARLRHRSLGKVGEVVSVRGEQVTLDIDGTRVIVARAQLAKPEEFADAAPAPPLPGGVIAEVAAASAEQLQRVDVRGMDVEDAWFYVDQAIDRCLLHGTTELELVHGKGTGRLREQLGRRLSQDPRVRRAAVGGDGRYDEGVTLVEC